MPVINNYVVLAIQLWRRRRLSEHSARMKGTAITLLLLLFFLSLTAQPGHPQQHHWEETVTETIWRERYTNCDYGYYVSLPAGVVAHGTHSPNPNHGIYVSLPDVGNVSPAADDHDRFVWVDAHYNASDYRSLASVVKYEMRGTSEGKAALRVVQRKASSLGGVPAVSFIVQYEGQHGRVTEQRVIALRSGVVYTVALQSLAKNIAADREQFDQIRRGFTLLPLPQGECSNDR